MGAEEAKIIKLCKGNKREGYNLLYEKYEAYIYSLCFRYTRSKEDSLDLLQDVYLKIYQGMPRFKEGRNLLPWIRKITINTCLNFVTRRRDNALSLSMQIDENENTLEDIIPSHTSVVDEFLSIRAKKILKSAILGLPKDMKMAIILRHMEAMSYREIAKAMSIPIGTVKTLLFRGRKILKGQLMAQGVWEE
ncbi:MAG TPA: RNA polymerase sigma factor [Clostridia bacterium]|nr:RNA polymerase sigma factor [Clostridia bacterium]